MNKKLTTLIGAILAVCAYSTNAASVVGTPFSFAVDAAQDPLYSSTPGADNATADDFTADSPFTVGTTFDISTGQKFVGVLHYHNSAGAGGTGTLTGVSFGGQALDFSTGATGSFGTKVAITYWDATNDITDGNFSVSFDNSTNGIDEFSFTLYALSGLVAGGPRDFVNGGGAMPSAEVLAGDFILATGQRNNGPNGYGGTTTGMTLQHTGGAGNLKYGNSFGFGDGDTIIADGGSSTGFLTNVDIDDTGTRFDLTSVTTFAAIPEPSAAILGGIGMLLMLRRRRQG